MKKPNKLSLKKPSKKAFKTASVLFLSLLLIFLCLFFINLKKGSNTKKIDNINSHIDSIAGNECEEGLKTLEGVDSRSYKDQEREKFLNYQVNCNEIAQNYTLALGHAEELKEFYKKLGGNQESKVSKLELQIDRIKKAKEIDDMESNLRKQPANKEERNEPVL